MHQTENEHTNQGFALGLVIGAAAGAGLALLFAPKPGARLRADLGDSVTSLRHATARRLRDAAEAVEADMDDVQSVMANATGVAAGAARHVADAATEHVRPNGRSRG